MKIETSNDWDCEKEDNLPYFKVDKPQEAGDPHLRQIFLVLSSFPLFYLLLCCKKIASPTPYHKQNPNSNSM